MSKNDNLVKENCADLKKVNTSTNANCSFFQMIKFAFIFMFKNKLKFFLSLILTLITIIFLGISIVTLNSNPTKAQISMLIENNLKDVIILPNNNVKTGNFPLAETNILFTDNQINNIKQITKQDNLIYVYEGFSSRVSPQEQIKLFDYEKNLTFDVNTIYNSTTPTPYSYNYKGYPSGIIEMEESDLDYTEFIIDERIKDSSLCHFPSGYNEIALTSFKANMYMEYGVKRNDGTIKEINSIDDLIGETLDKYVITAIYTTEEDIDFSKRHSFINTESNKKTNENNAYLGGTYINNHIIMKKGFVNDFCLKNNTIYQDKIGVFYKLNSNNKNSLLTLMKELKYKSSINEYNQSTFKDTTYFYNAKLVSPISSVAETIYNQKYSVNHIIFLVITIFSLILDIFILSSFTGSNYKENKAISCIRKIDLHIIGLIEITFICLISFALSSLIINLLFQIINKNVFCNYFVFDSLSVIILVISTIGLSVLSSIISFSKSLSK